jgi:hypothetical protein
MRGAPYGRLGVYFHGGAVQSGVIQDKSGHGKDLWIIQDASLGVGVVAGNLPVKVLEEIRHSKDARVVNEFF